MRACEACGVPFTRRELRSADAIHRDPDTLADVHASCCPRCAEPVVVTVRGLAPEVW